MINLKKLALLQNVALAVSFVALICSFFSLILVSKYSFNEETNIKKTPETKIIKIENVTAAKTMTGDDSVYNYELKFNSQQEKKQTNNAKNNNNSIGQEGGVVKSNQKYEQMEVKKNSEKKTNSSSVKELKRIDNKQDLKSKNTKAAVVKNNNTNINNKKSLKNSDSKKVAALLNNTFVVQIGAFNKMQPALQQCQIAKTIIKNKNCEVKQTDKSMFRAVVFAFTSRSEAEEATKRLSDKLKIKCILKKSI